MKRLLWMIVSLAVFISGCQPIEPAATQPLPTIMPTVTPPSLGLDNAERAANIFLAAWQAQDFEAMYRAISSISQSSVSIDRFTSLYTAAQDTMTFESLTYKPSAIERDPRNPRLVTLVYDVTFKTRLVGQFTDSLRELQLVLDDSVQDWRVAWTPNDIFAEIGSGGQLALTTTPVIRANIYDRDGVVLASEDGRVVTVNVVKRNVGAENMETCFATLVESLDTPANVIQARLNVAADDWFTEVGTIEAIRYEQWEARLVEDCDATFGNRPTRVYPNGNLAPHILGSVGYPNVDEIPTLELQGFNQDSILGRNGIERGWDTTLRGKPGITLRIISPNSERVITSSPLQAAESVWLTLDTDLQQQTLNILSQAYADNAAGWGDPDVSKGGSAIVMDINTGEILAMVSWPTFDANALAPFPSMGREASRDIIQKMGDDERLPMLNRATQGRYPSGSVIKVATVAAAADSGTFTMDQRFSCGGTWQHDNIVKTDWLPGGHGTVNLAGLITQSCNIYTYEIGYQMNLKDPYLLPNYFRHFGLGQPTGLTDIEEDPGSIGDPDTVRVKYNYNWSFADAVVMAIGQGEVEVTPLQITRLIAAIANGGTLYRPRLVQKAGLLSEFSYVARPEVMGTMDVSPEVLEMVRSGMCDVTTTLAGTATHIFEFSPLQDIGVCGKTGTAQNLNRGTTHAWFGAYAPREKPEIAVVVMIEDAGEGSGVAAPIARDILQYYFFGSDQIAQR